MSLSNQNLINFLVAIFIISLNSCGFSQNSKQAKGKGNRLEFEVNADLLSRPVADSVLELELRPPKNWQALEYIADMSVRMIYVDSVTQAGFSVEDISHAAEVDLKKFLKKSRDALKQKYTLTEVDSMYFTYNNFYVNQRVFTNPEIMIYRLEYLNVPKKFIMNFTFQRNQHLETNLRKAESTIGSIQLISN